MVIYAVVKKGKYYPEIDKCFLDLSNAERYIVDEICFREDISEDDFWINEYDVQDY